VKGTLFFTAADDLHGRELWLLDVTGHLKRSSG
jgi:ELWxxDGT repeat protein